MTSRWLEDALKSADALMIEKTRNLWSQPARPPWPRAGLS